MAENQAAKVTMLLHAAEAGDQAAGSEVGSLVYSELRSIAKAVRRGRAAGETVHTTVLVHEAYAKLVGSRTEFEGAKHFYVVAAKAMRQILIDYARSRARLKRRAEGKRVALDEVVEQIERREIDLLALDEALGRLAALDERKARVVELRFFGGLEIDRTADLLGVGHATVERDWRMAKAWLRRELGEGGGLL